MEITLGQLLCQVERPEPLKFAWPMVVLPEFFTTRQHLSVLLGYLATIGWEVYSPDLRAAAGHRRIPPLGTMGLADLLGLAGEVVETIGRPTVVLGHGMGGLLALKLAETHQIKAAVALAPLVPGLRNGLINRGLAGAFARWMRSPLSPPRGRSLFEFLLDVEAFQRAAIVKSLVPDAAGAAREIAAGHPQFANHERLPPRLIIAGAADPFVPLDNAGAFANSIGARLIAVAGRGHWLVGGRGLERTIGEAHRFLVRSLGEELLLLFPEQP